uniref:Ig-like domain-containing protein n=1 Tax=Megaselia scalaris TaxID=36166 RepID=T1GG88_MEGSC
MQLRRQTIQINCKSSQSAKNTPPPSTAILECDAKNFKASDVVIWYNGSKIIVQGGIDMQKNPRVRLVENNGIEIADVIAADEGTYSCQILPSNAKLDIHLKIVKPITPDVSIWYREKNISDNILTVQQTDHVEFNCNTQNINNPKIKWSLN